MSTCMWIQEGKLILVGNFFNDPCSKHTTNAGAAARSTLARLEMSFLRATSLRRTRFLLTPALLTAGLRCTTPRPKPLTIQKAVTTCKKKNNGRSTPGCLRLNFKNKKNNGRSTPGSLRLNLKKKSDPPRVRLRLR